MVLRAGCYSVSICPLEWRYGSEELRKILRVENFVKTMAMVELALMEGLVEAGIAPKRLVEELRGKIERVNARRVYDLEKKLGHEVGALVWLLGQEVGEEYSRFIHYGATSNDIIDTAWALIIRDALMIIKNKLKKLVSILIKRIESEGDYVLIGRTHGQHALPVTWGFKLANYVYELTRCYERLVETEKRVVRLKLSGAVGTMAAWGDRAEIIVSTVSRILGLEPHVITTQVAPRDGFAELVCNMSILAGVLERIALEVRELSRPEIREVSEGFIPAIGSSAMPHKVNPILSEKICGLARVLRGYCSTMLENIALWHERDLSNSSCERITIPHALLVLDEMLESSIRVWSKLVVYPENMRRNLELTYNTFLSEAVVLKLVEKGVPRNEAYERVRKLALKAIEEKRDFIEVVLADSLVSSKITRSELKELVESKYTGLAGELARRVVEYARKVLGL